MADFVFFFFLFVLFFFFFFFQAEDGIRDADVTGVQTCALPISYKEIVNKSIKVGGSLIIGAFSEDGPEKCSGIPITQYSETTLKTAFSQSFKKNECIRVDHTTPFNTTQNFVFCRFNKLA